MLKNFQRLPTKLSVVFELLIVCPIGNGVFEQISAAQLYIHIYTHTEIIKQEHVIKDGVFLKNLNLILFKGFNYNVWF